MAAAVLITNANEDKPEGGRPSTARTGTSDGKHDNGHGGGDAGTVALELTCTQPGRGLPARGRGRGADRRPGAAGRRSGEFERKEFALRFPSGFASDQLTVKIAGNKRLLPKADGPAAYEITAPQHVRTLKPPGESCP